MGIHNDPGNASARPACHSEKLTMLEWTDSAERADGHVLD